MESDYLIPTIILVYFLWYGFYCVTVDRVVEFLERHDAKSKNSEEDLDFCCDQVGC